MVFRFLALGVLAFVAGCKSADTTHGEHAVAAIVDLSTSTADLARDFDAHAGEPRFVMLLSPT